MTRSASGATARSRERSHGPETLLAAVLVADAVRLVRCPADLARPGRRVVGVGKVVWAVGMHITPVVGPLAYLAWGRDRT